MKKKQHEPCALRPVDPHVAAWLKKVAKSPHTAEAYRRDLNAFLAACGKPWDAITPADVNAWADSLCGTAATKQRKVVSVRSFYKWSNGRDYTNVNLERIEIPAVKSADPHDRLLTPAEVAAMVNAARPDVEAWLFVRLLYLCALRVSDAINAKWRDLLSGGEEDGYFQVLHIGKGKGGKVADVPVPDELWADLHESRGAAEETARLFPGIRDRHMAARLVAKLATAAKIEKIVSPHSFRHACISHLLDRGAPLTSVRDLARHASVGTTNRYAHSSGAAGLAKLLKVK
jgi:integrase/recombinase XerD